MSSRKPSTSQKPAGKNPASSTRSTSSSAAPSTPTGTSSSTKASPTSSSTKISSSSPKTSPTSASLSSSTIKSSSIEDNKAIAKKHRDDARIRAMSEKKEAIASVQAMSPKKPATDNDDSIIPSPSSSASTPIHDDAHDDGDKHDADRFPLQELETTIDTFSAPTTPTKSSPSSSSSKIKLSSSSPKHTSPSSSFAAASSPRASSSIIGSKSPASLTRMSSLERNREIARQYKLQASAKIEEKSKAAHDSKIIAEAKARIVTGRSSSIIDDDKSTISSIKSSSSRRIKSSSSSSAVDSPITSKGKKLSIITELELDPSLSIMPASPRDDYISTQEQLQHDDYHRKDDEDNDEDDEVISISGSLNSFASSMSSSRSVKSSISHNQMIASQYIEAARIKAAESKAAAIVAVKIPKSPSSVSSSPSSISSPSSSSQLRISPKSSPSALSPRTPTSAGKKKPFKLSDLPDADDVIIKDDDVMSIGALSNISSKLNSPINSPVSKPSSSSSSSSSSPRARTTSSSSSMKKSFKLSDLPDADDDTLSIGTLSNISSKRSTSVKKSPSSLAQNREISRQFKVAAEKKIQDAAVKAKDDQQSALAKAREYRAKRSPTPLLSSSSSSSSQLPTLLIPDIIIDDAVNSPSSSNMAPLSSSRSPSVTSSRASSPRASSPRLSSIASSTPRSSSPRASSPRLSSTTSSNIRSSSPRTYLIVPPRQPRPPSPSSSSPCASSPRAASPRAASPRPISSIEENKIIAQQMKYQGKIQRNKWFASEVVADGVIASLYDEYMMHAIDIYAEDIYSRNICYNVIHKTVSKVVYNDMKIHLQRERDLNKMINDAIDIIIDEHHNSIIDDILYDVAKYECGRILLHDVVMLCDVLEAEIIDELISDASSHAAMSMRKDISRTINKSYHKTIKIIHDDIFAASLDIIVEEEIQRMEQHMFEQELRAAALLLLQQQRVEAIAKRKASREAKRRMLAMTHPEQLQATDMDVKEFLKAAKNGDVIPIQRLLDTKDVDMDGWIDTHHRYNALGFAAMYGHYDIVKLLAEEGADLQGQNEMTPLLIASHYGYYNIVKLLLDYGVQVNYRSPSLGTTALLLACKCARFPPSKRKHHNHEEVVRLLLQYEADPNLANTRDKNRTPLMEAVRYNEPEIVMALLRGGADISKIDINSQDALMHATNSNRGEIVQILLRSKMRN